MFYKKRRAIVMLCIALLLAGAAVFLAKNWVQEQVRPIAAVQEQQKIETTKVVVASLKLHYGNKILKQHLRVIDWPVKAVPEGSFKSIGEILGENNDANDRIALRIIEINEPILKNKITGFGGRASLSTLIAPGMRASTIRVNDVTGVAGFVLPGDRVDILLTRKPTNDGHQKGNLQTDVFLQNMKVLAIGQDANEDRNKVAVVKAITLEVTPVQAQKLVLAQKLGSLSLALRHINTVDAELPQSIRARDLGVSEVNLAPNPVVDTTAMIPKAKPVIPVATTSTRAALVDVVSIKTKKTKAHIINIVRGIKATEYEVEQEKPTFGAPAFSKPLILMPSLALTPLAAPILTTLVELTPLVSCNDFETNENCM